MDGYALLYEEEFERVARTVYLVLRDAASTPPRASTPPWWP
ncbi:MAG TPA: hypothetical protein VES93_04370 [Ornithinibacter sp.]|nr:hypothetical protein [Ornithinibacter sp.]